MFDAKSVFVETAVLCCVKNAYAYIFNSLNVCEWTSVKITMILKIHISVASNNNTYYIVNVIDNVILNINDNHTMNHDL